MLGCATKEGAVRCGAQSESDGKCKADGVDDEVGEAPVSAERREVDVHVVAPFAQVVIELKVDKVGGVVEREVGYVDGYGLARV
jgi:hypothetical protein